MIKLVNHHLTATRELTYQDFRTIATLANQKPFLLKLRKPKVPNAAAHFATRSGSLTTFNNTGTETENTYRKGDALITRLTPTGIARGINGEPNTYIVKKKDFPIFVCHKPSRRSRSKLQCINVAVRYLLPFFSIVQRILQSIGSSTQP